MTTDISGKEKQMTVWAVIGGLIVVHEIRKTCKAIRKALKD